jgi:tetratricopeptide (TPR) repeat protein
MSAHYERAMVLMDQHRFEDAVKELRQAVIEEPDCPYTHGMQAISLGRMERYDQAIEAAAKVIEMAPDLGFSHYIRALVYVWRGDLKEARIAIQEAIRLNPGDPQHYGILARIEFDSGKWTETVAATDQGLALDPKEDVCLHYRSLALAKLGRREEAEDGINTLLRDNPEDSHTHAARGMLYLEQGNAALAKKHFLESLRLDPTNNDVRHGLVNALSAQNVVFGKVLQLILYLDRFRGASLWLMIIGAMFGLRFLNRLVQTNPESYAIVFVIKAIFFTAIILIVVGLPLFDIILRFDREGRMALTENRIRASNLNIFCFISALLLALYWAWLGKGLIANLAWATMMLPAAIWVAHLSDSNWVRQRMMWVVCAAAILIPFSYFLLVLSVILMVVLKMNFGWLLTMAIYLPLVSILMSAFANEIVEYLERKKPDDAE